MSVVTFTYNTTSVTLTGKIIYGTEWWDERRNFFEVETSNGNDVVYNGGPDKCFGVLMMKDVSRTEGDAFYAWLKNSVNLSSAPFTIGAVAGVNLGNGINASLSNVRFAGGRTLQGLLTPVPPFNYEVKFPYKFLRS
jgi:hypothetical protein